jgi:ABC-2 type transport system ATP-binding protein
LSVRENLAVYAGLYGIADADRAIDRVLDTIDLRGRASTRAAELSKGMRQKTALARALLHDPAILLLDEPTSGLDPEVTRTVRQLLRERRDSGGAILVSTHNLDEAERIADRVVVLQGRLVAAGTASELRRRLITGRVLVRVAGDPGSYLAVARGFDAAASADDATLTVAIGDDIEHRTPALVAALVAAGAAVLEVRQEIPALEDVYLHLVGRR